MSHPGKEDENQITDEPEPDDPSCHAIAVDLGKDIAEDIAQGENKYSRRQNEGTQAYYLYSNNIGSDMKFGGIAYGLPPGIRHGVHPGRSTLSVT